MNIVTEPIALHHGAQVEGLRKKYGHRASAHAFTSLYIWRNDMGFSLYFGEEFYGVKAEGYGENCWIFPCGDREKALPFVVELLEQGVTFCYMNQQDVDFMEEKLGDKFQATPAQGDDEYLYLRQEQESLAGRKFMRIRNDINRGKKEHSFTCVPLTAENLTIAKDIHTSWVNGRSADSLVFRQAGYELLEHFRHFDIQGVLGYVDGVPTAVVAGYPLSETVFDLSLSNQTERISGISPWTRQQLVAALPPQYTTLNAEEDLGIPGLRQMKEIMRPSAMEHMFVGRLRR